MLMCCERRPLLYEHYSCILLCDWQLIIIFQLFLQIDALSKRSKEAENAFLNVYKKIIDVPGKSVLFAFIYVSS